ncbi:flagellar hook-associated protein FlgK [Marimonas arenosa]|uniref:Flagellar hook-associated protein 1 n=1 Tax=Marimonas arenosa TaxID=1795305 RepID=A0AAE3WFT4_9RHOB|nr:flagellar hook-associated protein FlgK [Marimonas arenosa]MDQ2090880.1 flagellar hook-associated protein FlgK [Marimonas arenosa]
MSLSGALSNALSGLTAASRAAQITASNLSNIMTEGYGRRELEVSARVIGGHGGVQVNGILRHANPGLIAERRMASSDQAGSSRLADFFQRLEALVGTPVAGDSLSARIADFEASLVQATSRPDLAGRLNQVFMDATEVVKTFARVSDGIQTLRGEADREIGATVDRLNTTLGQVRDLNIQISHAMVNGRDTSAMQDQRQILVDEISEIVPVKEFQRDLGAIALFTPGGAILVDGTAAELSFSPTNVVVPHMTLAGGLLSGLEINGEPVSTAPSGGPISGGRLAALFQIRDELAPETQSQLDAVARDLVERFQDAGLDATRAPGDPGLFTDGGLAFAAANEMGLAGRLEINAAVDPDAGGATWRLRDGLGAAVPGPVGNSQLLQDMQAALNVLRVPTSGDFGTGAQSATNLQATFLGEIGSAREVSDQAVSFAAARFSAVNTEVLEEGVDSDQEMQRLMLIEQAYAANARMMEVVDDMMQALMRI